ncbi:MAG: hypothetical protein M3N98_04160, partial [Actinomycetota bacterium]|nr:hypothetical protein [Actinomycetota bacterium]
PSTTTTVAPSTTTTVAPTTTTTVTGTSVVCSVLPAIAHAFPFLGYFLRLLARSLGCPFR